MSGWHTKGEFNGNPLERIRLIRSDGPSVSYNSMRGYDGQWILGLETVDP